MLPCNGKPTISSKRPSGIVGFVKRESLIYVPL